jgi:2-polyprenyl-6-methoxyphenol hydroxylase-like FAD-dependent oxidoreductase
LGLNIRGQSAIKHFDTENRSKGLWAEIFSKGVESDAFFLHIGKKKFQIRKPSPKMEESERKTDAVPPTLLIPRNKLSEAMLNILERNYGATNRLRVEFNSRLESVDLNRKVAIINDQEQPYDLIIGSDGVQSCVRGALIAQRGIVHKEVGEKPFISEEVVLPGQYKVMQQPFPSTLESDAVHAMENGKAGYGLFLIPAPGNRTW